MSSSRSLLLLTVKNNLLKYFWWRHNLIPFFYLQVCCDFSMVFCLLSFFLFLCSLSFSLSINSSVVSTYPTLFWTRHLLLLVFFKADLISIDCSGDKFSKIACLTFFIGDGLTVVRVTKVLVWLMKVPVRVIKHLLQLECG